MDRENRPFSSYLADPRSYVVQLGAHRIVMLDSAWDAGIVNDKIGGLLAKLGLASEDEKTFVGGSPNSEGVSDRELSLVADALQETPDGALVIVGLHAPLFNPWAEAYPYFLRETQRPALGRLRRSTSSSPRFDEQAACPYSPDPARADVPSVVVCCGGPSRTNIRKARRQRRLVRLRRLARQGQ